MRNHGSCVLSRATLGAARTMAVLAGIGAGWRTAAASAQQQVPLVMNHLEAVLDSATFADVKASPFLRDQFAAVDTVEDPSHDGFLGVRLFGKFNWITLGHPVRMGADRAESGDVAMAFSSDVPLAIEKLTRDGTLKKLLTAPGTSEGATTRDYLRDFHTVARLVGPGSTSQHARFEILQYGENISGMLAQVDSLPVNNLSNARFLARYYDRSKLFEYLSGATLAIPVDDIAKIVRVLERDSVTVLHEGEGVIIALDGFKLHLIPPWTGAGVKQLQFALTRDVPANPVYRFGPYSRLRFGPGPIAVWDFNAR